MRGQRGWRELSILGDKLNKFTGVIESLIWSPRGEASNKVDDWAFEEVLILLLLYLSIFLLLLFYWFYCEFAGASF